MALRIIIPVKPFAEAKRRLASVLSVDERGRLARNMFLHVLAQALGFAHSRNVIVISRAPDVLAVAETAGALALAETSSPDLNAALVQAAEFSRRDGGSKLLVVVSDLPLLSESDLAAMATAECAIAPDRHERGTNALLWPASQTLAFHFGANSLERHRAAAKGAGFVPQIVKRQGLAHDVDLPSDLLDRFPPPMWALC